MKRCPYCGRENEDEALSCHECGTDLAQVSPGSVPVPARHTFKLRWLALALVLLAGLVAYQQWLQHHPPLRPKLGVVILKSWVSNGQQVITFRPEPPDAEIAYACVASVLDDGSTQPATFGSPGFMVPLMRADETNFTLQFLATPLSRATMAGRPLTCTPGSYTVAYTPQQRVNRVRVGVALKRSGLPDLRRRLLNAWSQKSVPMLFFRSHEDPVFFVTQPFTNPAADSR